jgi:hypothetical protein
VREYCRPQPQVRIAARVNPATSKVRLLGSSIEGTFVRRLTLLLLAFCLCAAPTSLAQGPESDSDGDGITDFQDSCPSQPGAPESPDNAAGCPPLDRDKDGVPESKDECPAQGTDEGGREKPVPIEANGCQPFYARINVGAHGNLKDFISNPQGGNVHCQSGPYQGRYIAKCTVKATVSFDAATTKKLHLKSSRLDSFTGEVKRSGTRDDLGHTYGFVTIRVDLSNSLKRKLRKLARIVLITSGSVTDAKGGTTEFKRKSVVDTEPY